MTLLFHKWLLNRASKGESGVKLRVTWFKNYSPFGTI